MCAKDELEQIRPSSSVSTDELEQIWQDTNLDNRCFSSNASVDRYFKRPFSSRTSVRTLCFSSWLMIHKESKKGGLIIDNKNTVA